MEQLLPEERRGLILLRAYEKACRKTCGAGYRSDPISDESVGTRPSFKQAVTVAKWLDEEGMKVGVGEMNWSGFVGYVFEHFAGLKSVPAVGQLKNPVLLKRFFQHVNVSFARPAVARTDTALEDLYSRILLPEIGLNFGMRHLLGLLKTDRSE